MDIADYANESPVGARLGSLSDFMKEEDLASPIDMYGRAVRAILTYGTKSRLRTEPFLGRLLVLGIVSAAEAYFRGVLSACIEMCPVAQSGASSKTIAIGGLLWHGRDGFSRSAFEHASFSSKEELIKVCKDYLGFAMDDATFKSLLSEYDIVCQLRHGIVHGDGLLPGKNAVRLDIPRYSQPVRITVGFGELQDVAAVVSSLVLTFNRVLFTKMCERWAFPWRDRADWEPASEAARFKAIWEVFHSVDQRTSRRGARQITWPKCMAELKAQYAL